MGPIADSEKRRLLLASRVIWLAMLLWPFLICLMAIAFQAGKQAWSAHVGHLSCDVSVGLSIFLMPFGYCLRSQIYKRYWQECHISPIGYLSGNVALWTCCSAIVFLGLATIVVTGSYWPAWVAVVTAVLFELINFPNGLAMEPTAPALGDTPCAGRSVARSQLSVFRNGDW